MKFADSRFGIYATNVDLSFTWIGATLGTHEALIVINAQQLRRLAIDIPIDRDSQQRTNTKDKQHTAEQISAFAYLNRSIRTIVLDICSVGSVRRLS